MTEKVPVLVMLGIGIDGKPHAAQFAEHDAPLVARAAELMGFHVIQVAPDNEELHGVAERLPRGRIFSTGRGFVPFVSRAGFDKLAVLVVGGITARAPQPIDAANEDAVHPLADMFKSDAINTADALWAKVEFGTVVLAAQPDLYGPGWWEGVVVGVDGDDLTTRWMDDASLEPIHVSRRDVALRHPGSD
ncbi:MAG TPA: hypothetical protein VNF04_09785 [Stellaceae bacterium]|nr:hypothetical protein [Stellaceae bacterium]